MEDSGQDSAACGSLPAIAKRTTGRRLRARRKIGYPWHEKEIQMFAVYAFILSCTKMNVLIYSIFKCEMQNDISQLEHFGALT